MNKLQAAQIKVLKAQYATIERMTLEQAAKLERILDKASPALLKQLVDAEIEWVSMMASWRIKK